MPQLARMAGLAVIGTAGSAEGMEIVLKEGADHVLNHREDGYLDKVCCLVLTGGLVLNWI